MQRRILFLVFLMSTAASGLAEIQSGFGIMFLDHEPAAFEKRLLEVAKSYPVVTLEKSADESKISMDYQWVKIDEFPLPKPSAFNLFSVGLKPSDRDRIIASKRTIFLNFSYSESLPNSSVGARQSTGKCATPYVPKCES